MIVNLDKGFEDNNFSALKFRNDQNFFRVNSLFNTPSQPPTFLQQQNLFYRDLKEIFFT